MQGALSEDQHKSFFEMIVGRNDLENDLSRLFCACFSESPDFAQTVLTTIWRSARLSGSNPSAEGWECHYQPATPFPGRGRPDFCLLPPPGIGTRHKALRKPIFFESKVGSPLKEDQLRRYKEKGAKILVAITKNWPEISQARLNAIRVKSLRWQDVCRALRQTKHRGQKDRFLCERFANYLEESDMTYPEDISVSDLKNLRLLFLNIASPGGDGSNVPRTSFTAASDCIELLKDVKRLVREKHPKLARWKSWGPGYYHYVEDNSIVEHALAFILFQKDWRRGFRCDICFPVAKSKKPYLWISNDDGHKEKTQPISSVSVKGKLNAKELASAVVKAARDWRVA